MKFGLTTEILTIRTCGPGWLMKMAIGYWERFYKYIGSLGFDAIEVPSSPFIHDPVAWEVTRTGMPVSDFVIKAMYGSFEEFFLLLKKSWINEVPSVHLRGIDAYEEIKESFLSIPENYLPKFEELVDISIDYLSLMNGKYVIISPTPELGIVKKWILPEDTDTALKDFEDRVISIINKAADKAAAKGVTLSVTNEFWSVFRKDKLHELLDRLDHRVKYTPDTAHLYIQDEDITAILKNYKERLACVKISDTKFKDVEENYLSLHPENPSVGKQKVFYDMGDGDIDIVGVYKTLQDIGYDDYLIFNTEKTTSIPDALLKMNIMRRKLLDI
jgi:inosose dehydratase